MIELIIFAAIIDFIIIQQIVGILHNWVTNILSPNEAQFWGAVIGGIIGVFGAYWAAMIGIKANRRDSKLKAEKQRLDDARMQVMGLEVYLQKYINVQQKNSRLLDTMIANDDLGDYMMTLPRRIEFDINVSKLENKQLVNEALTLELSIRINNEMIEDFVEHYKDVAHYMRPIILEGRIDELRPASVEFQHADMIAFAEAVKASVEIHLQRAANLLGTIYVFAKYDESDPFKTPKELIEFKASEKLLKKERDQLKIDMEEYPFEDV